MYTGKIRTVIYDKRFEREMARIQPNIRRADEFLEGTVTVLSRQPELGRLLDGSNVWFICGHTVDVAIYYTFDADNVYFLSAERVRLPEL